MGCIRDETLLERYLDGELSNPMADRVQSAIESCDHCRLFVDDMTTIRESLNEAMASAVEKAPLDDLWDRIESRIDENDAKSAGPIPARWVTGLQEWLQPRRLEVAMSMAALLVAGFVGVWMAQAPPPTETSVPGVATVGLDTDNSLIVESFEYSVGVVSIDIDLENKASPAVFWHFVEDEKEGS